jgi:GT2 family glycosyltransferase
MTEVDEVDLFGLGQALDLADELSWAPMRLVPPDPWVGHIPFAFWLIKALRPEVFVELGTHSGNSYFAFCQAIASLTSAARAYAVDTWAGDEHAGHYGEDVFAGVQRFNTEHFLQFSTLLRTTFDGARDYFPDGQVDLLHIDGLHSYDAVKHDFERWQSALSTRAVVLFHDINVREREFGVWRLWDELRQSYPHFEFIHSNGLGVLGVGEHQAPLLRQLFASSGDADTASSFRRLIASRGEAFQRQIAVQNLMLRLGQKDEHIENLTQQLRVVADHDDRYLAELRWRDVLLADRGEVIAAKEAFVVLLSNLAAAREASLEARDAIIRDRDDLVRRLADELKQQRENYESQKSSATAEANADIQEATQLAARARTEAQQTVDAIQSRMQQVQNEAQQAVAAVHAQLEATVRAYVNSTSWKVTRPLRVAVRLARSGRLRPPPAAPLPEAGPVAAKILPPFHPEPDPAETATSTDDVPATPPLKTAMRGLLMARLNAFLSTAETLRFPQPTAPDVSILLVLYNQADLTFACLGSILETLAAGSLSFEVVIVDNHSTDLTQALLDRIEGARILRNAVNLHFLKAVNQGSKIVQGRAILLLNNDAQLLPGAVASALRTLDSSPDIGAVGGRIILADGTLQEAGSIVWQDGACSGYGRGQDPTNPDFMFQRDVDYCSGAFLLTPAAVFEELGGFDPLFSPAYYEETDYCIRLWESGRRVVFDPDVAIIHYEFGSSSAAAEALTLQANNHKLFAAQHRSWLARQFPPSPANVLAARTARSNAPRILVLEDRVPKIELGTGYPRSNHLLHELVDAGAQVTLFPMHRHPETWLTVRNALDKRIEILIRAEGSQIRAYLEARRNHFDAIIVCRPHNMEVLLEAIGSDRDLIGSAKLVYDAEALFVTRQLQKLAAEGHAPQDTDRHRLVAKEVSLTRLADAVVSVAPAEEAVLEDYGVKRVYILGHSLDDKPIATGFEERDQILFLGAIQADDAPNADAVKWFAADILPYVRHALGDKFRLTVVGKNQAPTVEALDGDTIDLVGMVDDLAPALARARVLVVPTRFAAGIPHKVHQAAMLGIPMVVTDLIFEQLGWDGESSVLVASDSKAFAESCVRLYTDRVLWESVRLKALERVRRDCAPEVFTATIRKILSEIPLTRRRPDLSAAEAETCVADRRPTKPVEPQTSRPAETDYSVIVPFGYLPRRVAPRVAVMCHMFYPDLAKEVLYYLRNIPAPADMFLSTDTEEKRSILRQVFGDWDRGDIEIRVVPNRGRDIAPKLVGFADRYDYDLVLHLHSKVSEHARFLAPWRGFLFENLAGSPAIVSSIFDAFDRLPDLGMVASQHYESIRRWIGWNGNFEQARVLATRMGMTLSRTRALDFPSGSMFWARPAALRPLLDLNLSFDDFPEEGSQLDETPAHAIERLYFHVCERGGFSWLKVGQKALFMDTSTMVAVPTPQALSQFVGERGVMLSGPGDVPCRVDAAPMMTRVPPGLSKRLAARVL